MPLGKSALGNSVLGLGRISLLSWCRCMSGGKSNTVGEDVKTLGKEPGQLPFKKIILESIESAKSPTCEIILGKLDLAVLLS